MCLNVTLPHLWWFPTCDEHVSDGTWILPEGEKPKLQETCPKKWKIWRHATIQFLIMDNFFVQNIIYKHNNMLRCCSDAILAPLANSTYELSFFLLHCRFLLAAETSFIFISAQREVRVATCRNMSVHKLSRLLQFAFITFNMEINKDHDMIPETCYNKPWSPPENGLSTLSVWKQKSFLPCCCFYKLCMYSALRAYLLLLLLLSLLSVLLYVYVVLPWV